MQNKNKKNDKFIAETLFASARLAVGDTDRTFVMTEEIKVFIGEILDNLDLPTDCRKLLNALLEISNGRIKFKATRQDIVRHFQFPNENVQNHTKTDRVWDAFNQLNRWSQNNIELIKVEHRGMGRNKSKGHCTSSESVFEFVLLKKLEQFVLEDEKNNFINPSNLKEFLSRLKNSNRRKAVKSLSTPVFY